MQNKRSVGGKKPVLEPTASQRLWGWTFSPFALPGCMLPDHLQNQWGQCCPCLCRQPVPLGHHHPVPPLITVGPTASSEAALAEGPL